jgi:hypothetical protein
MDKSTLELSQDVLWYLEQVLGIAHI